MEEEMRHPINEKGVGSPTTNPKQEERTLKQ
jgi:hypothetical protein